MKRLLRHTASGMWVSSDGTLTNEVHCAVEIESVQDAVLVCRELKLTGIEIILLFPQGIESRIPMADI